MRTYVYKSDRDPIIAEHQRRIKLLSSSRTRVIRCDAVAERLRACEPDNKCNSGACYVCGTAFKALYEEAVAKAIGWLHPTMPSVSVSVTPANFLRETGELNNFEHKKAANYLSQLLSRSRDRGLFIAGLDYSVNERIDGTRYFQPHWYGVAVGSKATSMRTKFGPLVRAKNSGDRPLRVTQIGATAQDFSDCISYSLKLNSYRRVSYRDPATGRMNTRKTSLARTPEMERELLVKLDNETWRSRVFAHKFDLNSVMAKIAERLKRAQ